MTKQVLYRVIGDEKMHCEGCETRVSNALRRLDGVHDVKANANEQSISVSFNTDEVSPEQLESRLDQLGYKVVPA